MTSESLSLQYGPLVEELSAALAVGDESRASEALDAIVQLRESRLFSELSKLTIDMQDALARFELQDFASKEIPDARHRLDHVLKMTDEAAHKTMDLIEQSAPIADRACRAATSLIELWKSYRNQENGVPDLRAVIERTEEFLTAAQFDADTVRRNLNEVLMTQGYQDLTGQIIRGVIQLVGSLETALVELTRLSQMKHPERATSTANKNKLPGPAVPGVDHGDVVNGQKDVDSLLSGLGL
jgi:chemotaxis protein CheZ